MASPPPPSFERQPQLFQSPEPPAPPVASPVEASPPVPDCDCWFDCCVSFTFTAVASPDSFEFDWLTSPLSPSERMRTDTFVLVGAIWTAFDWAFASWLVEFEFDAFCDCETSPP